MLRYIYTLALYLLLPFILLRLLWKSRKLPAYRHRIFERLSIGRRAERVDVWLHAVSLGEVVAATPLINALLAKQQKVMVTTMTPTGSQQVISRFGHLVAHQYIPYDLPYALRRFFKNINASVGVIMETEMWPNLIVEAHHAKLPLLLMNARISDKAFESYQKGVFFFKPLLSLYTAIFAQSDLDAKRFVAIGAPLTHVHVMGNMKFDLQIPVPNTIQQTMFKTSWGDTRPVFIVASTHAGEESLLLAAFKTLKNLIPGLLMIIAPRHPERFNDVFLMSQQFNYTTCRRSEPDLITTDTEVLILDSLGELLGFYQMSHYAFVGGSFVPIGGHNVLEPIAMNVPVFCGPHMQNSKSICVELCAAGALVQVMDVDELVENIVRIHQNEQLRVEQITNASRVLAANKGCVDKCLHEIMMRVEEEVR